MSVQTEKNSIPVTGLTEAEVKERIEQGKVNGDQNIKTKSVGKILFTNIFTLFNFIFVVIAIILIIFTDKGADEKYTIDDFSDFGFVMVMLINMLIGIIQELKAKHTIDKLSLLSAPKVTVIRDGEEKEIAIKDIVLDDLIRLSAGRQICSDSVVTSGFIEVNESLITGEPDAVPKSEGDELLSGSFVVSGKADCKVIRVGKENYATKISSGAKYIKTFPSEIRRSLIKFIRIMGIVIIPLGVALFCVKYLVQGNELIQTVRSVMGNLIGMIPSGLVMLTSAVFCVSVIRLARHKALAQDLYCVETLARVDVLCLDKTGTITEGSMDVEEIIPYYGDADIKGVLKTIVDSTGDNNVTAAAIKEYCKDSVAEFNVTRNIPFSSKYKFSGIEVNGEKTYVFGAPEFILTRIPKRAEEKIAYFAEKGMRVTALAETRVFEGTKIPARTRLLALVIISDKIRKEAPDTLRFFAEQGVNIKIISGDNALTVSKIAERAGVSGYDKYVDASTLNTEEEMSEALENCVVFGRTTPDKKLELVKLLRKQKHTVAMTGDGVNDVLALRESDCSIAMASGSDAAKNVSQLVLLDSNFACLPRAVAEGRRTINNLERSASLYLVKTLYNIMFALVFLIISSDLPFEPKHMTFISALTIGIPSVLLALEPNKELVTGKFFRKVISNAIPAAITVVICVVTATLMSRIFPDAIGKEELSTICTILTGFIGFMYIAKISYPFNAWRIIMLCALVAIFVAAFFARFEVFDAPSFFGLTTEFNKEMILILGPVGGLSVPLFIGLTILVQGINKKIAGKKIKILDAIDGEGEK